MAEIDICKLKVKLQLKDPFLGGFAYMVPIEENNSIDTACTDGIRILYNSKFLGSLSIEQQLGIYAHELMHMVLLHALRFAEIEEGKHYIYNIAGDMVINSALRDAGFELPAKCYFRRKSDLDLSTEEIYKKLLDENIKAPKNYTCDLQKQDKQGNGTNDSSQVKQGPTEEQKDFAKQLTAQGNAMKGLANSSKVFSKLGSEYSRIIDKLFKPKLPWNTILYNVVNDYIKDDYSWRKPNKRMSHVAYLPSIVEVEALTSVNVYIDVSGSVNDDLVSKFISEVRKLREDFNIKEIRFQGFSTELSKEQVITDDWKQPTNFSSTGGTAIEPVVDDINRTKAVVNLVFTDGYFDEGCTKNIKYDTLWLIYDNDNFRPHKGKVIYIDE